MTASGIPLSSTELVVAEAMSRNGYQLDIDTITPQTALSQDAGINGIDVFDFAAALPSRFKDVLNQVPWHRFSDQRASFFGCQVLLVPFWLIYRIAVAAIRREPVIPKPIGGADRLTVRHLAEVLERGEWFEPASKP